MIASTERLHWPSDGQHWPHRSASRFVSAGGCDWHVQVHATGSAPDPRPVLWLLHGMGAASHSWRGLVPWLAPHCSLVVPDLPGHGFSGRLPAAAQSMAGMARALADLALALQLPPAAIVGHSAGAALAARAVLDGGLAPGRLVGINAALLPFDGLAGRFFGPLARWMVGQPLVPWLVARRARDGAAVQRLVAATGSQLDAPGLALYTRLVQSPAHVAGALAMMSHWDLRRLWLDLPRLPVPLALLVASGDATVPPSQAAQVQRRMPRVQVLTLPGLGHLAHEEAPDAVIKALRPLLPDLLSI